MTGPLKLPDPVDIAIAEAEKPQIQMRQVSVTIASTGRPAVLLIPVDVADLEVAELAGWMLTGLTNLLREERAKGAASRLVIPGRH